MAKIKREISSEEIKKERADEMFEAARFIAGNIKMIPDDATFQVETRPNHNALEEYLDGEKYYCAFKASTGSGNYPVYRLFIWPREDKYVGLLLKTQIDMTAAIANESTGEWEDDAVMSRIYQHELKNDTQWNILEQLAAIHGCCPYHISYPYFVEMECDNEEILSLYEQVNDCAELKVEEETDENGQEKIAFSVTQDGWYGIRARYQDKRYIFSWRFTDSRGKDIWETAKVETASEAIRYMLDHKAAGARLPVSKNAYVFFDHKKIKIHHKNEKLTPAEKKKINALIKELNLDAEKVNMIKGLQECLDMIKQ